MSAEIPRKKPNDNEDPKASREKPERNQGLIPTVGQILSGEGVQRIFKRSTKEDLVYVNVTTPNEAFNAYVNATATPSVSILGNRITVSWLDKDMGQAGEVTQWMENGRLQGTGHVLPEIDDKFIKIWEDHGGVDMHRDLVLNGAQHITLRETEKIAGRLADAHPNPEMTEKATRYHEKDRGAGVERNNIPQYRHKPAISPDEENE